MKKKPSRNVTGDRAVTRRKKKAQRDMLMGMSAGAGLGSMKKSKGGKIMKARGGKMAKGYAKGGSKMMKAMGGRMAMRPTNAGRMGTGTRARPMGAMKGKMAKGYAKGGAKMMKAQVGKFSNIKGRTQGRGTASDKEFKAMSMASLRAQAKKKGMKLVKA